MAFLCWVWMSSNFLILCSTSDTYTSGVSWNYLQYFNFMFLTPLPGTFCNDLFILVLLFDVFWTAALTFAIPLPHQFYSSRIWWKTNPLAFPFDTVWSQALMNQCNDIVFFFCQCAQLQLIQWNGSEISPSVSSFCFLAISFFSTVEWISVEECQNNEDELDCEINKWTTSSCLMYWGIHVCIMWVEKHRKQDHRNLGDTKDIHMLLNQ